MNTMSGEVGRVQVMGCFAFPRPAQTMYKLAVDYSSVSHRREVISVIFVKVMRRMLNLLHTSRNAELGMF